MKFKREYIYFLILIICGVSVILLGNVRESVRGRRITVVVSDTGGKSLSSVRVFAELARSGKTVLLSNVGNHSEQWSSGKVFIKRIIIGAVRADLPRISSLDIAMGGKNFHFSDVRQWKESEQKDEHYGDYVMLQVPREVRLETSRIPFRKDFFVSLMNWGGDTEILLKSLVASFNSIVILILFLVILRIILFIYKHNNVPELGEEGVFYKGRFILFFLTIVSTITVLVLINALIVYFYRPDVGPILKGVSTTLFDFYLRDLRPKPVERLQFVLSVLLSPIILALCYGIFKKRLTEKIGAGHIYAMVSMITGILLFAITYTGLVMSRFLYVRNSYYFDHNGRYVFNLIIFPISFLFFLFHDKWVNNPLKSVHELIKIILQAIFFMTIILVLAMSIFNVGSIFSEYHLNPVIFPVAQVVSGKILLVNLASQYGLFPLFLTPLFKVTGLSILKFSFVMGVLLVASYLLLFMFMRLAINNRVLLYSGFLGMIYYSYLAHPGFRDFYIQYWPIRLLFPCLFLFFTAVYLRGRSKYLYYASFILYALGILWNFDSGIIVFLSWVMALTYDALSNDNRVIEKYLKIAKHIVNAFVSLVVVFLCFFFWTYILSGSWPHFSMLLQYQKAFLSGFGLIPMASPPHPWTFIILIYLSGLLFVISRNINHREVVYDDKLIFILSILGIGLFSYYEGRSHNFTLFLPSYPAFILIAVFADKLYQHIKVNGSALNGEILVFAFLFYIIISAPFNIIYNINTYYEYAKDGIASLKLDNNSRYAKNIDFIKKNTSKGEGVLILSPNKEGIYYGETGTHSIIDISSFTDPVFRQDVNLIVDFLEHNKKEKVFAERPLNYYDLYDPRIRKVLERDYAVVDGGINGLDYYKKINE